MKIADVVLFACFLWVHGTKTCVFCLPVHRWGCHLQYNRQLWNRRWWCYLLPMSAARLKKSTRGFWRSVLYVWKVWSAPVPSLLSNFSRFPTCQTDRQKPFLSFPQSLKAQIVNSAPLLPSHSLPGGHVFFEYAAHRNFWAGKVQLGLVHRRLENAVDFAEHVAFGVDR